MLVDTFREHLRSFERINDKINKDQCFAGITLQQCHAITTIGQIENGNLNASDLAKALSIDKSTASRNIDGLVKKGYVRRRIPESNRRSTLISLTQEGTDLKDEINSKCNIRYQNALDQMTPEERKLFIQLFEKFITHLKVQNYDTQ